MDTDKPRYKENFAKAILIKMPKKMLEELDAMVKDKNYASRNELLRRYIREGFDREGISLDPTL
jgi:metal-responsive CopG/Arc/MetJ family transcriptional regulator